MYYYTSKQNYFEVVDINTGKVETISLKEIGIDENIISIYHDPYDIDSNIYVITNKYIIEYNACQKIKFADKFLISNIATNPATNGEKITKFFLDPFWGNCICTNSNGFDVRYNVKNYFTKHKRIDLLNYTAVGSGSDGSSIWWNESTRTVCSVSKNYTCEYFRTSASSASKNVHTTGKRDLHIGSQNHFLDLAKRQIYETCRPEFGINKFFVSAQDSNLWYVISNFGFAISDPRLGVVSEKYIDRDRYKDLIFDSLRNLYWAYNQNKILIYDIQQKNKIVYTKKKISKFGIQRAEKICLDNKYGNIFMKGYTKIVMYDYLTKKPKELFPNFNLKESSIFIYDNLLIVYGRFGMIFSQILGPQSISAPIYYENIKNTYFNHVIDVQFYNGKALLNTDLGTYSADIPSNEDFSNANVL